MEEPSSDLAMAVAIASSYYDQPVARDMAVLGAWVGGWVLPCSKLGRGGQ